MRLFPGLLPCFLLIGCVSRPPVAPSPERAKPVVQPPAPQIVVAPQAPAEPTRLVVREISGIQIEGVAFDSRHHRLAVVDQAGGPSSKFADAGSAARSIQGLVAVNAGFFTPEGVPLGLVVSAGNPAGSWNSSSSLGSGIWYQSPSGETGIARRGNPGPAKAQAMRELIQAGPLLVENSQPVSGLEATKTSTRIVVLWDGGTRWWIGRMSPCTLEAAGVALAGSKPAGWPVKMALNLDGGRSADLWISGSVPGGPLNRRTPWNRPVRNFLVLLAK